MRTSFILIFTIFVFPLYSQPPSIKSFTDGLSKKEGFINYYWDEEKGKLYLEIEKLDKELIYINYLAAGVGSNDIGLDRGQIGGTRIIKFIKMGPKILMVQPNYKFRAVSENQEEIKSVEDAFAKSTIWGFAIKASSNDKFIVDATEFSMRDSHMVSARLKRQNQGTFKIDQKSSSFDAVSSKNFPFNTEIESFLTFRGMATGRWLSSVSPNSESFSVRTRHSFVQLPDEGYSPRKFDPRAGYGAMTFYNYASPIEDDLHVKYIRRHRFIKIYPNKALHQKRFVFCGSLSFFSNAS